MHVQIVNGFFLQFTDSDWSHKEWTHDQLNGYKNFNVIINENLLVYKL